MKTIDPNQGRAVFDGATHSGYPVELHMTKLAPRMAPHAIHKHVQEEVVMLRSGTLEATLGTDVGRVGPGSVIYVASMLEHG